MKRASLAVALFLVAFPLLAGPATRAYLIGTRHPARQAVGRLALGDAEWPGRHNIRVFDVVDAFAADLTDDEVASLQRSSEVRYVEVDAPRHAFGTALPAASLQLRSPNGQTVPYGVNMVNAPAVWPATRGSSINVAVLDTGIDVTHPDLTAAYAGGLNTFYGNSRYPSEPQAPIDDDGHGTHVSGTIAAADNNIGVVGVAPNARLWMVRVLRSDGNGGATGSVSSVVQGIQWVMQQKQSLGGDWIISMSLGSCTSSITESSAVGSAVNAGILLVAAAGNHDPSKPDVCGGADDNSYAVSYPAAYPGVIAVAAVDDTTKAAVFSNAGPQVGIAAPGVGVLSTVRVGTGSISYVGVGGNTIAAAQVTGSPTGTLSGTVVDCGLGKAASDFPAAVNGNIAVIKRGDVTFATKVKNAQTAGASAVIIYNKDSSDLSFTLMGDAADAGHVWPLTVAISLNDGVNLLAQAPANATVASTPDDYENLSGTSMATPHVAAVAALAWSLAPSVTAETVKQALFATARDLGDSGVDSVYGNGLVNALAAAKQLNPGAFAQPPTTIPYFGRYPGRRGH